jgi:endoglucanase
MTEVRTDVLGSVTAYRPCGREGAKRVLLDAHIDEIGLIVTGGKDGFFRFAAIGGLDARVLPAATIKVLTQPPVFGVIDVIPPHVLDAADVNKAYKFEDLIIDAGEADIPAGTPCVFASEPVRLGEHLFCGKAMDDRAGLASIILALDMLGDTALDFDLYVLASAQEEVGRRGAAAAAYGIAPDYAIVVDMDFGDQPDIKPEESKKLGGGTVISYGPNMSRVFTDEIVSIAKRAEIQYQIGVEPGDSGTNAMAIQIAGLGCATALLGVPARYLHTPNEVVDTRDVVATAALIYESLKGGVFACI